MKIDVVERKNKTYDDVSLGLPLFFDEGDSLGLVVGAFVGALVGVSVGVFVGVFVGALVGASMGAIVGASVGESVLGLRVFRLLLDFVLVLDLLVLDFFNFLPPRSAGTGA